MYGSDTTIYGYTGFVTTLRRDVDGTSFQLIVWGTARLIDWKRPTSLQATCFAPGEEYCASASTQVFTRTAAPTILLGYKRSKL
jgi:hypothetical protein